MRGSADRYSSVLLYRNGTQIGSSVPVASSGLFQGNVSLVDGLNSIQASAVSRGGEGPKSTAVSVTVDRSIPTPPLTLQAVGKESGKVQLNWTAVAGGSVKGYSIYRSTLSFDDKGQATKLNSTPLNAITFTDSPANEGTYFYRISTVNLANTESALSVEASAVADRTPPLILSVQYNPNGNFDSASGRFGVGLVQVVVTVSEPLLAPPFFSVTPLNGVPIILDLLAAPNNQYVGTLSVQSSTPSGLASAAVSARDLVGNRGTDIVFGRTVLLDTVGPRVSDLTVEPSVSIRNNNAAPVHVRFVVKLDESPKSGAAPEFAFTLSASHPSPQDFDSVSSGPDPLSWILTKVLPADAGQTPEFLELSFHATDDLNNSSSEIVPTHRFQIYQGNLPSLDAPIGLSAKSLPGGDIQLQWQSVSGAVDYELFRKDPAQSDFHSIGRSANTLVFTDEPEGDGQYQYEVAAVRRENGQESLSPFSNIATALSDSVPPPAPVTLSLILQGNGIFASWQPPVGVSGQITYTLVRSASGPITSADAATLVKSSLTQTQTIDPSPSPSQPYYAVVAVDAAGNKSPPSNTAFLNTDLLPVRTLAVAQTDEADPIVTWSNVSGAIAGYDIFLGEDSALLKLNPGGLVIGTTFTDSGYAGDERRYTVITVDTHAQQSLGRSLTLPLMSALPAPDALVKRGLMNRLTYSVRNASAKPVDNIQLKLLLDGKTHPSSIFSLNPGASLDVPIIVGGYSTLPDTSAPLQSILEVTPAEGEKVTIVRNGQVAIGSGQLIVGLLPGEFTRGGSGQLQFKLFNPASEEIEVITAVANGASPSPDLRVNLLDSENHILSSSSVKLNLGSGILNLPNGSSVMRIAGGAEATSPTISLAVPANAPNQLFVQLSIAKVYYHSDRDDRVEMTGVETRHEISVIDTTYTGVVTSVTPEESTGDQPITISGNATVRATGLPAPTVPLIVKILSDGFQRSISVVTDTSGNFSTIFQPLSGEPGGIYSVSASHPDLNSQTVQKAFVIKRVLVSPNDFIVRTAFDTPQPVRVTTSTGPGTAAHNIRVEYRAEDQPGGAFTAGITVSPGVSVSQLLPKGSSPLEFTLKGTEDAPDSGDLFLRVVSDETSSVPWQKIHIAYQFSESRPSLRWSPSFLDTGVAPGGALSETITFENVGLAAAQAVTLQVLNMDGTPAPGWVKFTTPASVDQLAVGSKLEASLSFTPSLGTPEDDYQFRLRVSGQNVSQTDIFIHVAVVSSGQGNALFKIVDMFSKPDFSDGVQGARIRLQNEDVTSIEFTLTADTAGEALFQNVPVGRYKYNVIADKHQSATGRLWIRPGATASQQIALLFALVTVTWEVVPITIEDRGELVLRATFETDVPAPVIIIEPLSVNLPKLLAGDVFYGEFSARNYGLIRADNVAFQMPPNDEFFDFEVMTGVPNHLDAKQQIRIPYRVVCKKPLGGVSSSLGSAALRAQNLHALADGGECITYIVWNSYHYHYKCSNGLEFEGDARIPINYIQTGNCTSKPGPVVVSPPSSSGGSSGPVGVFGFSGAGGGGGPGIECFPVLNIDPVEPPACPEGTNNPTATSRTSPSDDARRAEVGSWVDRITREYMDEIVDLKIKIPGGYARVLRRFYGNQWHWADLDRRLDLSQLAGPSSPIIRQRVPYTPVAEGVFQFRDNRLFAQAQGGYRWESKDGDWEVYDVTGRMIQSGHRNLTLLKYIYDQFSKLIRVTDRGDRTVFIYHYLDPMIAGLQVSVEILESIEDLSGRTVRYDYTNGRLLKVTDAAGGATSFQYDAAGRMIRKTDVNGHPTTITYDGGGYVSSVLDELGNGHFFQFSYDPNSQVYYCQDRTSGGQILETRFDRNGELLEQGNGGITDLKIVRSGRTEVHSDAAGNQTQQEYDEFGNLVKEVRPDGGIMLYAYEPRYNQVTRIVDPLGRVTTREYDANGNLITETDGVGTPLQRTKSFGFDANNQLIRMIDARGNKTDYEYDSSGNRTREFDPDHPIHQTLYTYDAHGNRTSITDALGRQTLHGYNNRDQLVSVTDPLNSQSVLTYDGTDLIQIESGRTGATPGRILRYHYDHHHRRTQILRVDEADNEQSFLSVSYDPDGRIASIANALGQRTTFYYNVRGQKTRTSTPFSADSTSDIQIIYNQFGRPFQRIDPLGAITQLDYDSMDRVRTRTEALGTPVERVTNLGYDLNGKRIESIYPDSTGTCSSIYDYDVFGRRIAVRGDHELPRNYEYDANDNITAEIDGRGNRTEYTYDAYNRRTRTAAAGELVNALVFDEVGNVIAASDGNGNHQSFHYDDLDRLTDASIPLGADQVLPGSPEWWTANSAVLLRTAYNLLGQETVTSNIVGGITRTTYDAFGRTNSITDAAGLLLTYVYNPADQLLSIVYPVVSTAPDGNPATSVQFSYDSNNSRLLDSVTDRSGFTTRFDYDKRFQEIAETSPLGGITRFRYDALGRLEAETNVLGNITLVRRDRFDHPIQITDPDHEPGIKERIQYREYDKVGHLTRIVGSDEYPAIYAYDAAGNTISLTDGNQHTTQWEYDVRNRAKRKIYADGTFYDYTYDAVGNVSTRRDAKGVITHYQYDAFNLPVLVDYPGDRDVEFTNDPNGRLVAMLDGSGLTEWIYDSAGRLSNTIQHRVNRQIDYQYDREGNRIQLKIGVPKADPEWAISYQYDSAARLANISDSKITTGAFSYSWRTDGPYVASITTPTGIRIEKSYDPLGRLTNLRTVASQTQLLTSFTYTYDKADQQTAEISLIGQKQFAYDAQRRLISASATNAAGNPDPSYSFTYHYDPAGNRLLALNSSETQEYVANALNEYVQISSGGRVSALSYDSNGNLLSDGALRFTYDEENRITAIEDDVNRSEFVYDAFGGLLETIEFEAGNIARNVQYVNDGLLPLEEIDATGVSARKLLRGLDIANSTSLAGGIGGLLALHQNETTSLVSQDANGNVIGLLSETGALRASYAYDPYGHRESVGSTEISQPYGFNGKAHDSRFSIVHFGYRDYRPEEGRWLSRDPIEEFGGLNLFAFDNNDPINIIDPFGLCGEEDVTQRVHDEMKLWLREVENTDPTVFDYLRHADSIFYCDKNDPSFDVSHECSNHGYDYRNKKVVFEGKEYYGHELNYFVIGMWNARMGLGPESNQRFPRTWKNWIYRTEPSQNTYYMTYRGYREYYLYSRARGKIVNGHSK